MGRGWAIRTLKFIEVSYESGTLHKHCGDNLKPIPKDNSEYAVLCPLLRGSTIFFFSGSPWEHVGLSELSILKKSVM